MLPNFDFLIFDLDGTLWDTCATCALAWNTVLLRHKISFRQINTEDVRQVTGKPHEECIRTVFSNLPENQIRLLINETALEDNRMIDLHGGTLYDGVAEGLQQLCTQYKLAIVSNCQAGYIDIFLRQSKSESCFVDFECWGKTGQPKAENVRRLISRNCFNHSLFIGDSDGDKKAAAENKIPFAFVSYGFGKLISSEYHFYSFSDLTAGLLAGKVRESSSPAPGADFIKA